MFGTMHFVTYLTAAGVSLLNHYSIFVSHYIPMSYLIDERRLVFFRKLLVHDNIVIRTLVALPAVYCGYIGLCSKYDIKDPLSSRTYIKSHVFKAFFASVF